MKSLEGKKGLVVGIANEHSIAWGCAKAFHGAGAEIAVTYLNEKAERFVRPLAEQINSPIILPLDVQDDQQMADLFEVIGESWGGLDFLLHSIAFAPMEDLHGRVVDCSREGFLKAMDISCHSFLRMARLAEPLLKRGDDGGSLLTVTYYGSEKVVPHYGVMGPVKAALESAVRYLASDLGNDRIRVNALSPGPLMTRAASGIRDFEQLLAEARAKAPEHEVVGIDDVGALARFLVSDEARFITGNVAYVDAGFHTVL
ncbi:enoyl-ACP reductase FabI [Aestuariispira insulae]|uniref:Enoyl-[acyl-carrier-protein] reductase [NADH] n=1 Tax=Aestuariispira insulae TaxID=1461337 RepID=A0A3D9H3W3_9PROT|nr:enoyl-ACP reductase FabI [Aestuariispira insulae]RED44178.1 enoyl-[acyl-carrier-protein] reductase [NADH] [Aestuariispira insulae]